MPLHAREAAIIAALRREEEQAAVLSRLRTLEAQVQALSSLMGELASEERLRDEGVDDSPDAVPAVPPVTVDLRAGALAYDALLGPPRVHR